METSYNWDDINVGRCDLNHSEKFFAEKHLKHERIIDMALEGDKENDFGNKKQVEEIFLKSNDLTQSQNILTNSNNLNKDVQTNTKRVVSVKPVPNKQIDCKNANVCQKNIKNSAYKEGSGPVKATIKFTPNVLTDNKNSQSKSGQFKKCNTEKQHKRSETAPSVCKYGEIYKKHKEQMLQQVEKEEKKMRQFHSKPAPNFNVLHKKISVSLDPLKLRLTTPHTPQVYKKSKQLQEKRKKEIEEFLKKQNEPLKFKSRPARVLKEEPFKPIKAEKQLDVDPFDLHVEKRLGDRKQYNIKVEKTLEQKRKEVEERKKQEEEELVRNLRKAATFKAKPNPFKAMTTK